MLTRSQDRAWRAIATHVHRTGLYPTLAEIGARTGMRSKRGVHLRLLALEERGFLRRLPHRPRAMELLRWPTPRAWVWNDETQRLEPI